MLVHEKTPACEAGCVIHFPTDPHPEFKTHWREDRSLMERICEHGVGHPDADHLKFIARVKGEKAAQTESIHGCCGCCTKESNLAV